VFSLNHRYKLGVVHLQDLFYATDIQAVPAGYDAVYYYHCQQSTHQAKPFITMLVDLSPSPREILASFRKSTRKEIAKTLQENAIVFDFQTTPSGDMLAQFIEGYDDFANKKGIDGCNQVLIMQIAEKHKMVIASAMHQDRVLCQFMLVDAGEKMVVYYGYNTRFQGHGETNNHKLISGANRTLEYQCMLFAKEAGKKHYDICGLTLNAADESAANVDQYKLGFRGKKVTEYHFMQAGTLKGRLFCWLKQMSGGIG